MSTSAEPRTSGVTNGGHNGFSERQYAELNTWQHQTRVVLQPISAPSVLGLFAFAVATFIVTADYVSWFGTLKTQSVIFPFAVATGGLMQSLAAVWSYRARDTLATAVHGMWGGFWIAYGILWGFVVSGAIALPAGYAVISGLNYWFFTMAAVTLVCAVAAMGQNMALTLLLLLLGSGAALLGVAMTVGGSTWYYVGGYVTMASAIAALYTGGAMLIAATWGRTVLPIGTLGRRQENIPGKQPMTPIEFVAGEPGVRQGQ